MDFSTSNDLPRQRRCQICNVSWFIIFLVVILGILGAGLLVGIESGVHHRQKAIDNYSSYRSAKHDSHALATSTQATPLRLESRTTTSSRPKTISEWNEDWIANHKEGRYCLYRKKVPRKILGYKINTRIGYYQCEQWSRPGQFEVDPKFPDIVWLTYLEGEPSEREEQEKEREKEEKQDRKENHWNMWEFTHKEKEKLLRHKTFPDEYDPNRLDTRDAGIEPPE